VLHLLPSLLYTRQFLIFFWYGVTSDFCPRKVDSRATA
jgi:hypothetical protein